MKWLLICLNFSMPHGEMKMIIFPRHQIWRLSYNLVTPIEAHGCITKHHIFNQKAQQESSVLQDCGDIKIMYMSHNKFSFPLS